MDTFVFTASGSRAAFVESSMLLYSRTRKFVGVGHLTRPPGAAAAPQSRREGAGHLAWSRPAVRARSAAPGRGRGWRRPRHPPHTRAAPREPTRKRRLRLSTISLFNRILHISCGGLLPQGGGGGPAGAVPQCRRRSRTPCRPARRPLQSRIAAGPAAEGGGSEAPVGTAVPAGRGRVLVSGRPSSRPPTPAGAMLPHRRRHAREPLPATTAAGSAAGAAAPPRPPRRPPPTSAASSSHPPAAAGRSSPSRSRQIGTQVAAARPPSARSPFIGTAAAAQGRRDGGKGLELRHCDAARSGSTNPPQRRPHAASRRFRRAPPPNRRGDTSPRGDVTAEGAGPGALPRRE